MLLVYMKMPECCDDCPFVDYKYCCSDGLYAYCTVTNDRENLKCSNKIIEYFDTNKERAEWCPLIELPEKHGRLIDGDELWEKMAEYTDNEGAKMPFGENDNMICRDSILYAIESAPTIIPQSVDDTLNVDDQVLYRGEKCIVTFITIGKGFCSVMYDDGSTDSCVQIDEVRKTGKSFPQFSELLKQMKGE